MVQALINDWHIRQLDFVLAYPQADVECDLYLEIPQGFEFEGSRKTHCLKLIKNLCGSKAATPLQGAIGTRICPKHD